MSERTERWRVSGWIRDGQLYLERRIAGRRERVATGYSTKERAKAQELCDSRNLAKISPVLSAHQKSHSRLLRDAIALYLAERESQVSPVTWKIYSQKCAHLNDLMGHLTLAEIDAARVNWYKAERLKTGIKMHTLRKEVLTCLRPALRLAYQRGEYPSPPEQIIPSFDSGYKPVTRWTTQDLAWAMVRYFEKHHPKRAVHMAWLFGTGGRYGESERARRDHISSDFIEILGTKTERAHRTIPITRVMRPWIDYVLEHTPENKGLLFEFWRMHHRDIRHVASKVTGGKLSPNDFRRSFCSWHAHDGMPPHMVAKLMGHGSDAMVKLVYTQENEETLAGQMAAWLPEPPRAQNGHTKPRRERSKVVQIAAKRLQKRSARSAAF